MKRNWPLFKTLIPAWLSMLLVMVFYTRYSYLDLSSVPVKLIFFAAGLVYHHFFEYFFHRFPMHQRLPFCRGILLSHLSHHKTFYGENFTSSDAVDLKNITTNPLMFPVLFCAHFLVLLQLFPVGLAAAFAAGLTSYFTSYESCHWFSHVRDNAFNRFLSRLPIIGSIRRRQIRHHQSHHERPDYNFNFTPPYLGDRLLSTKLS